MLKGIPASPGIAIGEAFVVESQEYTAPEKTEPIAATASELNKLAAAVQKTEAHIKQSFETTLQSLGPEKAAIFEAHLAFLSDPMFVGAMSERIEQEMEPAEVAVWHVMQSFVGIFEAMDDEYMRERAADIKDVGRQLIGHLTEKESRSLSMLQQPVIVVAGDLTPSDTAQLNKDSVLGFAAEIGGSTSHSAIIARAMGLPAVLGLGNKLTERVKSGDLIILDGNRGEIIVHPSPEQIDAYEALRAAEQAQKERLTQLKHLPAETLDHHRVELGVNIGRPQDLPSGLENGAEGVGLFRSEFLYMDRADFPSEEEQFEAYREAAELAGGRPVIIRTLDIGGDKHLPYFDLPQEMNPFLGWRALRISLEQVEMFKTQLRAILRASAFGKVRVMFPMVSSVEQVRAARDIIEQTKGELVRESHTFDKQIEIGVMIEIPAAALIASDLAREVDFFSIGTNDLVQYTLAVDRMNEKVADLYEPYHPAVFRLIAQVIEASHEQGKWTGMCGELAGDPLAAPLLVGLGLDEFSMSASSLPLVKERIRGIHMDEAKLLAKRILSLGTGAEIRDVLKKFVT